MAELPTTADIAVIGAGIMGTSTAYHLAAQGASVVLIERETVAAGSTSKAAGGFRAQFADELNVRMAIENIERLARFEDEFGVDIDFKQWGYLFLLLEHELPAFKAAVDVQHGLGVPTEVLDAAEVERLVPGLNLDDVAGATYCPTDGYCTPEAVAQGYARAVSERGGTIVQGCSARSIDAAGGAVRSVTTDRGAVTVEQVVLTAGVWSAALAAPLGLDLPIRAEKRHVWLTDGPDPFPHELPNVIDFGSGFYFHREGEGLLFGGRAETLDDMAPVVGHRAPDMLELAIRPGWWGYYEISPDHNAMVGSARDVAGLHYATGFSGHGFQQGPVVGEHLAQLALGLPTTFDLSALDVSRFADGHTVPEGFFI